MSVCLLYFLARITLFSQVPMLFYIKTMTQNHRFSRHIKLCHSVNIHPRASIKVLLENVFMGLKNIINLQSKTVVCYM